MNVCPECKTKIYNPSASFCYKCGHRINSASEDKSGNSPLERNQVAISDVGTDSKQDQKNDNTTKDASKIQYSKTIGIEESSITDTKEKVVSAVKEEPDKLTKRWNTFILGANALSIMFLIVAVGLFFRANNEIVGNSVDPVVTINNVEIQDEAVEEVFESEVLKSELHSIVPKDVSMYAEGSNSSDFVSNFLDSSEKEYLEQVYELTLEDFLVFIKPNYAYIVNSSGESAAILQTGGFDFFERTYSKYQTNKTQSAPIITRRVGEYLVVSRDLELLNLMEEVGGGSSVALSADPTFAKSIDSVGGRAFAYIFTESTDYINDNFQEALKVMDLDFLLDEIQKAGTNSVYVAKEGSKYVVKPIN